jgi:transcriptional regulator with XRE-family HTH domain
VAEIFRERLGLILDGHDLYPAAEQRARLRAEGVTRSHLRDYLRGSMPNADTLAAIAAATRRSVDWFLGMDQCPGCGDTFRTYALTESEFHARCATESRTVGIADAG